MPESTLEDWAKQPSRRPNKCETCDTKAGALVRQFLAMKVSGESNRTVAEFYRYLRNEEGYIFSEAALGKHIRKCETDLWNQATKS